MSFRKVQLLLLGGLGALLVAAVILLWPSAGWHVSHAFGDFCYICHAGNNQSMDKTTAHTGMVPPLSDIKAGCQSCHPNDLTDRAQVYAGALGISLESGGNAAPPGGGPSSSSGQSAVPSANQAGEPAAQSSQEAKPAANEASPPSMVVESKDVVDYNQRYDEVALGQRSINWGNVILVVMIVLLLFGGGAFVFYNERKRRGPTFAKAKPTATQVAGLQPPVVEGYSAEVTALLPKIAKLNSAGLHALQRLLENPDSANELFHNLSKLDPELVNRVRTLDRSSRELLLAMSGD
jgi:hypothetical protein